MERLELIVVQLEEAKGLIEKGRVPHLRLAFILLDSVTELILHRTVQSALWDQKILTGMLATCKELAASGHAEAAAEIPSIEARIIPKSELKNIDRNFDAKVTLLVDRGTLDPALGPVLEKLHKYRNEMYHRDKLRREVLMPATLIYFDSACTALESYSRFMAFGSAPLGPEISRFTGGGSGFMQQNLPQKIAAQLRREVGLDLPQVRSALAQYLDARLDEISDSLAFIEDNLGVPQLVRGDALRLVQANLATNPTLEQVRGKKYPYSKADMERWRNEISALESISDKHDLVREYAAIEDAFEPFEQLVEKAALDVDREVQLQIDIARGK
ncbi:hypothetical protein [Streptomyces sp. NBC_01294]|uniref:hypothetical protein n=1 Tax=Streptomyces sp. NBC_01294 TaxID=2903815 RepID=UPI002DDC2D3F|nr:hypothetical protein [Streptomyces sp. NBC_01294]WRZ59063.1 hypothetical protein OG534_22785 [Streptomyces sp. NBC_01294]